MYKSARRRSNKRKTTRRYCKKSCIRSVLSSMIFCLQSNEHNENRILPRVQHYSATTVQFVIVSRSTTSRSSSSCARNIRSIYYYYYYVTRLWTCAPLPAYIGRCSGDKTFFFFFMKCPISYSARNTDNNVCVVRRYCVRVVPREVIQYTIIRVSVFSLHSFSRALPIT